VSLPIKEIANRQRMDVFAGGHDGANRLLIYTGIAVIDPKAAIWVIDEAVAKDTAEIFLASAAITNPHHGDNFDGSPLTFVSGTATASLASVADRTDSGEVKWSVRGASVDLVVHSNQPLVKFVKVEVPVEWQGEFTAILRISYVAFVSVKHSS
jgi:hypothetical protein